MQVSRQTFGRILADARKAVAEAVVRGLVLRIEGGEYAEARPGIPVRRNAMPIAVNATRGENMSKGKISISSEGPTLDSAVDPRFGRAAGFVILDPDTLEFEYADNGACQAMAQGAGIQAAELVVRAGAGVVLTGYVGPKAFHALAAAGVKVCQNLEGLTVRQAVEKYKNGEVAFAEAANPMGSRR